MEFLPSVPLPAPGQAVREATAGSRSEASDSLAPDFDRLVDAAADPLAAQSGPSSSTPPAEPPVLVQEAAPPPDVEGADVSAEVEPEAAASDVGPDTVELAEPWRGPDDHASARASELAAMAPHDRGRGPVRAAVAAARHIESVIARWNGLSAHLLDPEGTPDAAQVDEILRRASVTPGVALGHRLLMEAELPAEPDPQAPDPEAMVPGETDGAPASLLMPTRVEPDLTRTATAAESEQAPVPPKPMPEAAGLAEHKTPRPTPPGLLNADDAALAAIEAAPGRAGERWSAPSALAADPSAGLDESAQQSLPLSRGERGSEPALANTRPLATPAAPASVGDNAAPLSAPVASTRVSAAAETRSFGDAVGREALPGNPVPFEIMRPAQAAPNLPPRSSSRAERAIERAAEHAPGLSGAAMPIAARDPYRITPPLSFGSAAGNASPDRPLNAGMRLAESEEGFALPADVRLESAMPRDPFAPRPETLGQGQPARAPDPHMPAVSRQIAATAVRIGRDEVELALAPEELGKLRLRVARGEHHAVVTVWFERPEVLDAARRHLDQLMQDLKDSGLENATLDLRGEAGGQRDRPAFGERDPLGEIGEAQGSVAPPAAIGPRGPARLSDRQLDIRV